MSSTFKKILKRTAPKSAKLTPQFVKKSKFLSNTAHANIVYKSVYLNERIATAPKWSDTKAMRAAVREEHELSTSPQSKTSNWIYERNQMVAGPERDALTAKINASTLQRGTLGIAALGAVTGYAAVGSAAAGAAARSGVDDLPMEPYEYSRITDPEELYSGDVGSQTAKAKTTPASGGSNAGLWLMGGLLLLKVLL